MTERDLQNQASKPNAEKQAGPPAGVLRKTREELRVAKTELREVSETLATAKDLIHHQKQLLAMKDQTITAKDRMIATLQARIDTLQPAPLSLARLGENIVQEPKMLPFGLLSGLMDLPKS